MLNLIGYGGQITDYRTLMPSKDLCNLWLRNSLTDEEFKELYYNELYNLIKLNKFSGMVMPTTVAYPTQCSETHALICEYLKENLPRIYAEIYTEGVYVG